MENLKVILSIALLAVLSACSGGMELENDAMSEAPAVQAPAVAPAPAPEDGDDFRQRFIRWSEFAGVEPNFDETLQLLTELRNGGCCGNLEDLQAYLSSFVGKDRPTQRLIEELREANAAIFTAFECLKFGATNAGLACPTRQDTPFKVVQIEELKLRIDRMTALAEEARERLLTSARIIGFPIRTVESLPSDLEAEFAARFNDSIDQVIAENPEFADRAEELRVDAMLLRAVSLKVESGDYSFFQFIERITVLGEAGRGEFRVVPVAENHFLPQLLLVPQPAVTKFPVRP